VKKITAFFLALLLCSCASNPVRNKTCTTCTSPEKKKVTAKASAVVTEKKKRVLMLYSRPGERKGRYSEPGKGKVVGAEVIRKVKVKGNEALFTVAPERVRPFVLRVWIAPWRDTHDRLKWARTVYVDLPINRWNIGIKPTIMDNKKLLQILSTHSEGSVARIKRKVLRRKK